MFTGCFTILIPITTIILFYFTNKQAESPSGITWNRYLNAGSMTSGSMLIHCPPLALANLETKVKVKVKPLSCVQLFTTPWTPGSSFLGIF